MHTNFKFLFPFFLLLSPAFFAFASEGGGNAIQSPDPVPTISDADSIPVPDASRISQQTFSTSLDFLADGQSPLSREQDAAENPPAENSFQEVPRGEVKNEVNSRAMILKTELTRITRELNSETQPVFILIEVNEKILGPLQALVTESQSPEDKIILKNLLSRTMRLVRRLVGDPRADVDADVYKTVLTNFLTLSSQIVWLLQ